MISYEDNGTSRYAYIGYDIGAKRKSHPEERAVWECLRRPVYDLEYCEFHGKAVQACVYELVEHPMLPLR